MTENTRRLRDRIQEGPMPFADALMLVEQLAEVIATAHARGRVFRDIRPDIIFLTENDTQALLDIGMSLPESDDEITFAGTVMYKAPEQFAGKVTRSADIFALGFILYELLTGQYPYDTSILPLLIPKHATEPVPMIEPAEQPINAIIQKATAKQPEDRYQDIETMLAALRAIMPG